MVLRLGLGLGLGLGLDLVCSVEEWESGWYTENWLGVGR